MKKNVFLLLGLVSAFALTSFTPSTARSVKASLMNRKASVGSGSQVLRILNSADYIYIDEDDDTQSMIPQFEAYARSLGYTDCEVVYETSDTNETIYSQMLTGKADYDLVNFSDYMIQKCIHNDLVDPFNSSDSSVNPYASYRDETMVDYDTYASQYIRSCLDNIEATKKDGTPTTVGDYAVGYMWGTLGILFNPTYSGYDTLQCLKDATSWDIFWNRDYNGTISIKDSMRDTYAAGIMKAYEDEFQAARDLYEENHDTEAYRATLDEIFNRCEDENIADVKAVLDDLKTNIFGLEVDSGKRDIVRQTIGMNLCWSGDAVYAMDLADDPAETNDNPFELCYSIPELGANLWFDNWIMPKTTRSDAQRELAYLFLDYTSMPENARKNIDYTGYSSFIGGDDVLDLMREWYDIRAEEIYAYTDEEEEETAQVYAVDPDNAENLFPLDYDDFLSTNHESARDDFLLAYFDEDEDGEIQNPEEPHYVYLTDENDEETETVKTYGDLDIVDQDEDLQEVNLNYFFNNDFVSDPSSDDPDCHFYTDCYYYVYEDGESGETYSNQSVGRQFYAQFPDYDTITRCAVMRDYGDQDAAVLKMWEKFKSDSLPVWAIVLFITEIVVLAGGAIALFADRKLRYRLRLKRRNEKSK